MRVQPDEEWIDRAGSRPSRGWTWFVAITAALTIVGLGMLYAAKMPLGDPAIKTMTER